MQTSVSEMHFTQEQLHIFRFVASGTGHGIIDAVAGAGKTTTIIESAAHVNDPGNTLFCAFNTSISKEISQRFQHNGMHAVTVKTLHALGYQMLRIHFGHTKPTELRNDKYQQLLTSPQVQQLLKEHYREILVINRLEPDNLDDKRNVYAVRAMERSINYRLVEMNQKYRSTLCKDNLLDFTEMVVHFGIFNAEEVKKESFDKEIEQYFKCHQILLAQGNVYSKRTATIDFTDMLYLPVEWKLNSTQLFGFVFIDECQDLSKSQLAIAMKYCRKDARILAVGDPRQSIYGFTGADIDSFNRIKDLTKAVSLPLTQCFRCPQKVVELAKEVRPDIVGSKTEEGLVQHILADDLPNLVKENDLVISRLKAPLTLWVFYFIDKGIRVQIHEDDAKDFVKELKHLFTAQERSLPLAQLPNGFGKIKDGATKRREFAIDKEAERIIDHTEREFYVIREKKYLADRLEFLHKKSLEWADDCDDVDAILKKILEFITARKNAIRLSTIHRAKGLEENRIFIIDYDKLPFLSMELKEWERVQEINLKYVAVTRAKEALFLVESEKIEKRIQEGSLFDDLFLQ